MEQTIAIPLMLYERLGTHATGFETPASVIERLLDFYEEQQGVDSTKKVRAIKETPTTLEIIYHPFDEESFKLKLLETKKAYLALYKLDDTIELKEWNAKNFDETSSVNGNLRSGYLREWKKKGITKAEISTDRNDLKL